MTRFWIALVLFDLVGLLGGAWLLFGPHRERPARIGRDLVLATGWAVLLAVVAAVGGIAVFRTGFAVLRLWCHALFCVLAPLAMARGLWWILRGRARGFGLVLVGLGLVMDAVYVYAREVEPYRLEVTHHRIEHERLAGLEKPLSVVLLADLQTDDVGDYEREVFAEIDALAPDLLLLAGDYVHVFGVEAYREQRARVHALFGGLRHRPPLGILAIQGDTERSLAFFDGTDVRMLAGERVVLDGVPLQVIGLRYEANRRPLSRAHLAAIEAFDGFTIVLGHRPDFMIPATDPRFDLPYLGLAGHTHGGQVVVPGFGPPMTLTNLPRRYAAGGLHRPGAAWTCVSRGVGMERLLAPRIRFLCPPELVVFELAAP